MSHVVPFALMVHGCARTSKHPRLCAGSVRCKAKEHWHGLLQGWFRCGLSSGFRIATRPSACSSSVPRMTRMNAASRIAARKLRRTMSLREVAALFNMSPGFGRGAGGRQKTGTGFSEKVTDFSEHLFVALSSVPSIFASIFARLLRTLATARGSQKARGANS